MLRVLTGFTLISQRKSLDTISSLVVSGSGEWTYYIHKRKEKGKIRSSLIVKKRVTNQPQNLPLEVTLGYS
jgi:hypothetical protein